MIEDVAEEEQDDSSRDEDEEEAEEDGEVESDNEYRGPWNNYTREELYNKWKNEVEKRKQFLDKAKTSEKELGKKKNKVESLELANKNLECENRSLNDRLSFFRKEFDHRLKEKNDILSRNDTEIKSLKTQVDKLMTSKNSLTVQVSTLSHKIESL